jgi:hypothetical protein
MANEDVKNQYSTRTQFWVTAIRAYAFFPRRESATAHLLEFGIQKKMAT